jgi:ankyrin repeat protein
MMSEGGNDSSQSNDALLEELLYQFCRSESLSEKGLREIITPKNNDPNPNDPNINNYAFFHLACWNERVTGGILQYLLEYFPNAVRHTDVIGRLPLHYICQNKNVTLVMVQLLIDAYPETLRHEDHEAAMPLHLLCRNKDLDDEESGLEILKLFIMRCPESVRHAARVGILPIHIAAANQSPEFCRILIEAFPGSEQITYGNGILPFHLACQYNTVATAKYFYRLYPESINMADDNGGSPIHYAIEGLENRSIPKEGGIEVVKFLLECNPDVLGATEQTPLHIAFRIKHVTHSKIQLLIDAFPDSVSHEDIDGRAPLHLFLSGAEYLDDEVGLKILKLLLERCPESVRHAAGNGNLPIHFAAAWQPLEFCRILIEAYPGSERMVTGGDVLPFHMACAYNNVATAKYLYKLYPESINVAANHGVYPIHFAIHGIQFSEDNSETAVEIIQFLLDCDPDVVLPKHRDAFPLYWVCAWATDADTLRLNGYLKVLQLLYDAHPEAIDEATANVDSYSEEVQTFINTQVIYARQARDVTLMRTRDDENGQLPLHRALCKEVCLGSIKLLVNGNPSAICTFDNRGTIPLHVACQHHESPAVVEYLIGLNKVTLTTVDREGNTALHYACRDANHAIIALLLDKYGSISVSKRNTYGQLPIDLLLENNEFCDEESVKYTESIYQLLRANPETITNSII